MSKSNYRRFGCHTMVVGLGPLLPWSSARTEKVFRRETHDQINLATIYRWEEVWRLNIVRVVFLSFTNAWIQVGLCLDSQDTWSLVPQLFQNFPLYNNIMKHLLWVRQMLNVLHALSPLPHNYLVSRSSLCYKWGNWRFTRLGKVSKSTQVHVL